MNICGIRVQLGFNGFQSYFKPKQSQFKKVSKMNISLKRIYNKPSKDDGTRVLVDKLWPRGISKEDAKLDKWWKEITPSDELRKWFDHDPEKWESFGEQYREELKNKKEEIKIFLEEIDQRKRLTLLYGAKDETHNHARVLREYLQHFS